MTKDKRLQILQTGSDEGQRIARKHHEREEAEIDFAQVTVYVSHMTSCQYVLICTVGRSMLEVQLFCQRPACIR